MDGVATTCPLGPFVLARDVVEDQVQAQAHPLLAHPRGEGPQVVHRAEVRADRAVVLHGVAAVVGRRSRLQQRQQVEVGDTEVAQVVQPVTDAGEGARVAVDVRRVAQRVGCLEPVRLQDPTLVEVVQVGGALGEPARGHQEQSSHDAVGVGVHVLDGGAQVRQPALDPPLEGAHEVVGQVRECGEDRRSQGLRQDAAAVTAHTQTLSPLRGGRGRPVPSGAAPV